MNRKKNTTNLPLSARLFEDLCHFRDFPSQKHYFSSWLLFIFSFFVILNSFFSLFFQGLHLLKAEESNEHFQNYDSFVTITALSVRVWRFVPVKHLLVSVSPFFVPANNPTERFFEAFTSWCGGKMFNTVA